MSISLDRFMHKVIFLDIDGVLYPYRGAVDRVHVPPEEYVRMGVLRTDPYSARRVQASETMKAFVESIKKHSELYVLGQMQSSFEYRNKLERIKEDYPAIDPDNVIGVASNRDKVLVMEALHDKYHDTVHVKLPTRLNRNIFVLIDDTPDILAEVENHDFGAVHISEFMP